MRAGASLGKSLTLAAVLVALSMVARAQSNQPVKSSPVWVAYHSERWMFCAAFPPGWQPEELFDGVLLKTQPPGHHDIDPVVTLGGYQGKQYEGKVKSLEELAEDAEDDLRDQMIRQLKTSNDKTTIEGKPALITAQSYLRGSEPWRAREVRILRADGVVVELALRGSDKRFEGLLPEFENMIATHLRIYCDGLPAQSGQPK